jgi:ABC-type nitrate/sulfonate/bicarbonate transport system ATPase subunit
MPEPLFALEHVTLAGRDQPRLHQVSLSIAPGVTAVLGPSGAGKSSLLDVLVGFEQPETGRVVRPPFLAWAPAEGGLWLHLTVRDHLRLVARRGADTEPLLHAFGLHDVASAAASTLSHGQRQRLAAARALATGAPVLVMDEPLAHLDRDTTERSWGELRARVRSGASLVFATHDLDRARAEAEHAVCLDQGKVAYAGPLAAAVHALLCVLLFLLPACHGAGAPALVVTQVRHHLLPPDGNKLPAPRALAPGGPGEWLVLDTAGRVLVLDDQGAVKRQWRMPESEVGKPEGVRLLRDGRIVVADTHYHRLVFFDAHGQVLSMLGRKGAGKGEFFYPVRLAEDPAGHLYVAEYGGNDRVQKLAPDGTALLAFGRFGSGPGAFQRPSGLLWHQGRVYVADAMNQRVQVFADDGAWVGVLRDGDAEPPVLGLPYDLVLGPRELLFVVEYDAGRVTALSPAGRLVGRFGSAGAGAEQLATPWALTSDGVGRLWIADTGNRRIMELRL